MSNNKVYVVSVSKHADETRALTSKKVHAMLDICKRKEDESAGYIEISGIKNKHMLNVGRLENNRAAIVAMLNELPEQFHATTGGGWTFLNACNNRFNEQWTDFHFDMEALFAMGQALGLVSELMPREMWDVLPGGMPYYVIDIAGI